MPMNTKRRRAPNGFRIQPNSDSSFHLYERGYTYARRRFANRNEALAYAQREGSRAGRASEIHMP